MDTKLAQRVVEYARTHETFSKQELMAVLGRESEIKSGTLGWVLYELVNSSKLARVKRGVYTLQRKCLFSLETSTKMKHVFKIVHKEFPFVESCLYTGDCLSSLQHHLFINHLIFLEVEKLAVGSVADYLCSLRLSAYANPTEMEFETYINTHRESIVVLPIISQSPLHTTDGIRTPKLEKILVDIYVLPCFKHLQGLEYTRVFANAYRKYVIREDTLLRYASRRHVLEEIKKTLAIAKTYD